jgi:hypothetical protein
VVGLLVGVVVGLIGVELNKETEVGKLEIEVGLEVVVLVGLVVELNKEDEYNEIIMRSFT